MASIYQYYHREIYGTPQWMETRARILERDGYQCTDCKLAKGEAYSNRFGEARKAVLTIAHLNGLPWDDSEWNLATLCLRCHMRHDRDQHLISQGFLNDLKRPLLMAMQEDYKLVCTPLWFRDLVDRGLVGA